MTSPTRQTVLDRSDRWWVLGIFTAALAVYSRVLAPDILYSDSGEFQTLAYTWGMTHTTGYPVYLLLARLVGLLPIHNLAWRINFASALAAALTISGVYLFVRHFVGRGGALLASLVLLVAYTFWSQSIIAEVYTPATAFIMLVLLLLLRWQARPVQRRWLLVAAGLALGLGLGVHMFLMLIAPALGLYLLWGIVLGPPEEHGHWGQLLRLGLGFSAGIAVFYALFVFMDTRPTPTNMFTTSIVPSRDVWELQASDLDSEPERFWISVSGLQWRDRMLPDDVDYQQTLTSFFNKDLSREYAPATLLLAVLGLLVCLVRRRRLFALLASGLLVTFMAALVYFPGDKFIFYLPFYLLLALTAGVGAGSLIAWIVQFVPASVPRAVPETLLTLLLIALCVAPFFEARWQAVLAGRSTFIPDDYVYTVSRPEAARLAAECAVAKVAESQAYLALDWQALYSIYYVAHVEQGRTGIIIREAHPYPSQIISADLLAEIGQEVDSGIAVYVDKPYRELSGDFSLTRVGGDCFSYPLFKVSRAT